MLVSQSTRGGEIEQQVVDREGVEPVAELAHDLGQPEPPEVAVAAYQSQVRGQ
jgi:hypothetical protein